MRRMASASGFSLLETVVAMGVLTVGMLGSVAVLARGMNNVTTGPRDLIATQKAAEAIESVFTARDTRLLTWSQIRNVHGASGADAGVFLDGPQPLKLPGADGLVNTADDAQAAVESIRNPGNDNLMYTADDEITVLGNYTREIEIRDVETNLRQVKVTIIYQQGTEHRQYQLITYISNYV